MRYPTVEARTAGAKARSRASRRHDPGHRLPTYSRVPYRRPTSLAEDLRVINPRRLEMLPVTDRPIALASKEGSRGRGFPPGNLPATLPCK